VGILQKSAKIHIYRYTFVTFLGKLGETGNFLRHLIQGLNIYESTHRSF